MPEPGNPQTLNRYSYSLSNPLKHTDPTGHCVDGLSTLACIGIGIVGGAAFGAGVYLLSGAMSGRFDNISTQELVGELAVSALVGGVGGALIVSVVGASVGLSMFATLGAGTGILAGEAGYAFTSGSNFDSTEMAFTAVINGVAGAASGAVGAPMTPFTPGFATGIQVGISAVASAGQYAAVETIKGNEVKPENLATATVIGGAIGFLDARLSPSLVQGQLKASLGLRNPQNAAFYQALGAEIAINTIRPAVINAMAQNPSDWLLGFIDDLVPDR